MKNEDIILSVAKEVRAKCVRFAFSDAAKDYHFHSCPDLECMCAVASHVLVTALKKKGCHGHIVRGEFNGNDHCWVEIYGHIVDITGSQFGLSDIVIVTKEESQFKYSYGKGVKITSYKQIRWGKPQSPHPHLTEKILSS